MNTSILKKLTFGFEIEGFFHESLANLPGNFQEDGSVHIDNPFTAFVKINESSECGDCNGSGVYTNDCECDNVLICTNRSVNHTHNEIDCYAPECHDDPEYHQEDCNECNGTGEYETSPASEYASEVFTSFPKMLAELEKFTAKTYEYGIGCGLHIHIGSNDKIIRNQVRNLIGNFEFIRKLHYLATKFCKCQRDRLLEMDNHFYEMPEDANQLMYEFRSGEKYRFVRFHPYTNTAEFRFMYPCKHKVENVEKLFEILTDYLGTKDQLETKCEVDDKILSQPIIEEWTINLPRLNVESQKQKDQWIKARLDQVLRNSELDDWSNNRADYIRLTNQFEQEWETHRIDADTKLKHIPDLSMPKPKATASSRMSNHAQLDHAQIFRSIINDENN